jgi:uracil-DNA glycosylase
MKANSVFIKSLEIRDYLKKLHDFPENPIDESLLPVLPFRVSNDIKLIIIGQDPTVKNTESRKSIEYTLNLDKNGSLKMYINSICKALGIDFENVYATNIFKYFYSIPPERTMNVLCNHLDKNLELLKEEISIYHKAPIITLGLPVLQLLAGDTEQVSKYWSYDKKTRSCLNTFSYCFKTANRLGRDFFPYPHQPGIRKEFYKENLTEYTKFLKSCCKMK